MTISPAGPGPTHGPNLRCGPAGTRWRESRVTRLPTGARPRRQPLEAGSMKSPRRDRPSWTVREPGPCRLPPPARQADQLDIVHARSEYGLSQVVDRPLAEMRKRRSMQAHAPTSPVTRERFTIRGDVGSPRFPPWIEHHARRLGLEAGVSSGHDGRIEVIVAGPPDLVDALEVGCSLGPIEVLVDSIERAPLALRASSDPTVAQEVPIN